MYARGLQKLEIDRASFETTLHEINDANSFVWWVRWCESRPVANRVYVFPRERSRSSR